MSAICLCDVIEWLNKRKKYCENESTKYASKIDWNYDSTTMTIEENDDLMDEYEISEKEWLGCYILLRAFGTRNHMIPYKGNVGDYIEYLFTVNDSIITRAFKRYITEFPMYKEMESGNLFIPIYPITLGF
jgi:hypothetical protein